MTEAIQSAAFMRDIPLTQAARFSPRDTPWGPDKTDDWHARDFAARLRKWARNNGVTRPVVTVERETYPGEYATDVVRFDAATYAALEKARLAGEFFSVPERAPKCVQVPWRIKNATPHEITLLVGESRRVVIPASGVIARVSEVADIADKGIGSIRHGDVEGLPAPEDGVLWVVSKLTAVAVAASGSPRDDLVVVGREVRDANGRIVGAVGLARIATPSQATEVTA